MSKEAFLLEDQGQVVLFSPIRGLIMELRGAERDRVAQLINQSQFSFIDLVTMFPEIKYERLIPKEAEKQSLDGENIKDFHPYFLTLFPTLNCNLRCVYCYSSAGEQKVKMNWLTAKTAIDFVIRNAKLKEQKESFLELHGGGEPTQNWLIFQKALDYFQEKAQQNGLTPKINIATNGVFPEKQINWIASRIKSIQVALDGPEKIHNLQRPTGGSGKSFAVVFNTIKSFLAKGIEVNIHCVVTEIGVNRIPEIVHFLISSFPKTTIHIEPSCECGRSLKTGQKFPSPDQFINGFIEAEKLAESSGTKIFYSGASPKLTEHRESFCGISRPGFVVTPTGLVSACHEVAEKSHPLADYFIYGYLDQEKGYFIFNYEKIKNIRNTATKTHLLCQECFVQYYCVGDCLAQSLNEKGRRKIPFLNPRCKINQGLTKHYVFKKLLNRKEDYYESSGIKETNLKQQEEQKDERQIVYLQAEPSSECYSGVVISCPGHCSCASKQ